MVTSAVPDRGKGGREKKKGGEEKGGPPLSVRGGKGKKGGGKRVNVWSPLKRTIIGIEREATGKKKRGRRKKREGKKGKGT